MRRMLASLSLVLLLGCGPDDTPQTPWKPGQYTPPTSVEYQGLLAWTFVPAGQSPVLGSKEVVIHLITDSSGTRVVSLPGNPYDTYDYWVSAWWLVTPQSGESVVLDRAVAVGIDPSSDCRNAITASHSSGTISSSQMTLHLSGTAEGCGAPGAFDASFSGEKR